MENKRMREGAKVCDCVAVRNRPDADGVDLTMCRAKRIAQRGTKNVCCLLLLQRPLDMKNKTKQKIEKKKN